MHLFLSLAFTLALTSIPHAFAATDSCHALDFDSYFVAQNAKSALTKLSDLSHPNFATHYLLLKQEMMMESIYLIADCNTGKFFHEKLNGKDAVFNLQSSEVSLQSNKTEPVEKFQWTGQRFMKIENEVSPSKAPGDAGSAKTPPAAPSTFTAQYQQLFQDFPGPPAPLASCHPLVFDSHFLAQKNKKSIIKGNADLTRANFAGVWILVKNESLFDTESLIASCETGKFIHATLKGNPVYQANSKLVRIEHSGSYPELYLFESEDFLQIPDPVQNKNKQISNQLSKAESVELYRSLPNPEHRSLLRFENLAKTAAAQAVFTHLHVDKILSGMCNAETGTPRCEVVTK